MEEAPKIKVEVELPDSIETEYGYEYKFQTAVGLCYTLLNFNDMIEKHLLLDRSEIYRGARWIFRGHWNSDWFLLPSAFRYRWYKKFRGKSEGNRIFMAGSEVRHIDKPKFDNNDDDIRYQIRTEYFLLQQFIETANNLGIDCNYTPFSYDDYKENLKNWSDVRIQHVMALARHHGIPTRLLDFTYNPLFAAFFSAFDSFEKKIDEDKRHKDLCVWAIDENKITTNHWKKISAISNRSSNLFAQEGLLILDRNANERFMKTDGHWQDLISTEEDSFFIKLTLPQNQCKKLLKLLWKNNVTPARIMPNLDKVTQTLEYNHWLFSPRIMF